MKTRLFLFHFAAALVISDAQAADKVSSHRKIVEQTDIAPKEWEINYDDNGILLTTSYGSAGIHAIFASHQEIPKLQEALKRFFYWTEVAKKNNVKELEKELVTLQPNQLFTFIVEDTGRTLVQGPRGHFLADDLTAYTELLKALPALKIEFAQAKSKLELFK